MNDRPEGIDESVLRNLDTQHRRLAQVERDLDRLLAGDTTVDAPPGPGTPEGYERLTATNDAMRGEQGWTEVDLDAALAADALTVIERWPGRQRRRWGGDDIAAVAVAGLVGIAATLFDTTIDAAIRGRLEALKSTPLIKSWENDARRMPIDYTGLKFGGPNHRVRSAGHDIARPFEALRQIRTGEFRGFYWDNGVRHEVRLPRYQPVENLGEALTLWGKHLVADVVTPKSLPPPGWSKLYELPSRSLRKFAHDTYEAEVNLRSLAASSLPLLTTEIAIRTHIHGRATLATGTARLHPAETALRSELLLAGHSLVGAAATGRALVVGSAAGAARGFRHINWPVLFRAAALALEVAEDARGRCDAVGTWDDLLADLAAPWQLDTAQELDRVLGGTPSSATEKALFL